MNLLIVLTSQAEIPSTKAQTGWYLPELAHPFYTLKDKIKLTISSPQGGQAPLDPTSIKLFHDDEEAQAFLKDHQDVWMRTLPLREIVGRVHDFDAIFYIGGHGPMFDLPSNKHSLALLQSFAAEKKPIAAVCHGPAALLNATAPSGIPLLSGAEVTGFADEEEEATGMVEAMPFSLQQRLELVSGGGYLRSSRAWDEKVVVSCAAGTGSVLITGQNPRSARGVALEILKALKVA
ncbi:hypothetical protein ASPZODRAFT_14734 [Penicilliopsis zonata CBS 506.65]|uniref:D-lactate dehydratase n=1 Tax=Penicilliopsis zonata CBS 506.65 TaxID=1073090 RepID=A0A1L9SNA9_9EURO|nr:hypothetical protein ASPZODRAFT_14734 [Penicilliopsis zonata CBS 506.65]OJJ48606.1 hypothetical protein ASPZODRAFT_14734 [Penicilliopsis zonata CBS 506.65]